MNHEEDAYELFAVHGGNTLNHKIQAAQDRALARIDDDDELARVLPLVTRLRHPLPALGPKSRALLVPLNTQYLKDLAYDLDEADYSYIHPEPVLAKLRHALHLLQADYASEEAIDAFRWVANRLQRPELREGAWEAVRALTQQRELALAMAWHPRLGAAARIGALLPPEVFGGGTR
jgi:hypothetical protein